MALSNAERQRAYRERQRAAAPKAPSDDPPVACPRCRVLEEEVRHLKTELAKRPVKGIYAEDGMPPLRGEHPFNSRPFTPVPKK